MADRIRALGTEVPALVVGRLDAGEPPPDVVVQLLWAGVGDAPELAETGRSRQLLELLLRGLAACGVVYFHHAIAGGGHVDDVDRDVVFDRFRDAVRAEVDRFGSAG